MKRKNLKFMYVIMMSIIFILGCSDMRTKTSAAIDNVDQKVVVQEEKQTVSTKNQLATPKLSSVKNVDGGVEIKWGKVNGAAKYRVFYKIASGKWKRIGETTSTSYTWKGAKSGTTYTYTVRCISRDGKQYTSRFDAKGKTLKYIAEPKVSSVTNVNGGVKIRWGKVTGAAKYRVFYKIGSGKWRTIGETTSTSYTWKGAKSGTTYTYTVRCISKDGKQYTSSYDTKGQTLKYIATPQLSSVTNVNGGVEIKWGKVTGAAKYRVFYKIGSGQWTRIGETTSTSYTWTGAQSGTSYTYTVRCISSDGQNYTSSFDTTGKTLKYVAAPRLSFVTYMNGGVTIVWDKVAGAAKYRVYYKIGSGQWIRLAETTSTNYTWTGAQSGISYTYTVRCISSDGKSNTSGYDPIGMQVNELLTLVNPTNTIPVNWKWDLVSLENGHSVDRRVYADLQSMLSDCRAAGYHPYICSSYRTRATQERLHNNKITRLINQGYSREQAKKEAGRWVAVPGTSEHELGLALDIVDSANPVLNSQQEKTATQKWLMNNSYKYGFILRYPTSKSSITGIGYEPWHYRYVGIEAATYMYQHGLCLEEYLSLE